MAAVYKSLSKRKFRAEEKDVDGFDQDVAMQDDFDSDDTSESEEEQEQSTSATNSNAQSGAFMPKTRVLMLTSRGVTHR